MTAEVRVDRREGELKDRPEEYSNEGAPHRHFFYLPKLISQTERSDHPPGSGYGAEGANPAYKWCRPAQTASQAEFARLYHTAFPTSLAPLTAILAIVEGIYDHQLAGTRLVRTEEQHGSRCDSYQIAVAAHEREN